jgi:hypothetical protein
MLDGKNALSSVTANIELRVFEKGHTRPVLPRRFFNLFAKEDN